MANITLSNNPTKTLGNLPKIGEAAKDFLLIGNDLQDITLNDFKGVRVVMNIFPSIETGVCASSVRNFNAKATSLSNTKVLCISRDLPFAQKRFCGAEGIENVITLSDFVSGKFGKDYELTILEGKFANLLSRCIIVLDENHKVVYTEQVPEIGSEPNYEAALAVL
ncbi:MAG: thiol peroxidase [Cryomorphaceae bacterium BACL11 MAG-121001-bin54]|jgi:thioredoxin-dependent peroxiredoxin|nr:MAG: thiol peroxidase [Cryomorphaceae bacterium BACL11 MAG-121001-bin54]KRO61863.1 MAG: thiol peroxidase [Cryomorphaceae bacterium BACL11 MAG-121015-bin20]KRO67917.1 MAG: thiol peroxidase [Cryomorphaceae bacterium BACL11 MAG-121128-bin16]